VVKALFCPSAGDYEERKGHAKDKIRAVKKSDPKLFMSRSLVGHLQ
jgi:hypothetical protein